MCKEFNHAVLCTHADMLNHIVLAQISTTAVHPGAKIDQHGFVQNPLTNFSPVASER
jgi:hypothetical protein